MARAKRTARAEARRRNRAMARSGDVGEESQAGQDATSERRPQPPVRPGIRAAFRESFRPLDLRADVLSLPTLVRHRSVLVPAAFTFGSMGLYLAIGPSGPPDPTGGTRDLPIDQIIATFLVQYFVATPPVGAVFLAGFLAPRAGWLTGLVAGVIATVALTILLVAGNTAGNLGRDEIISVVGMAFFLSPSSGVVFGGLAAWYRRFLMLTNPNRRAQTGRQSRPNQRRR